MAQQRARVDERLLRAFGDEIMRVARRRTTSYPGSVLDNSAFKILRLLVDDGPRTLRQIADDLQLEQSTINRQVNAALARGLLERYAGEGHGRLVRPTEEGRKAYRHDGAIRGGVFGEALEELGAERAHDLVDALRDFNDAFGRAHDRGLRRDAGGASDEG